MIYITGDTHIPHDIHKLSAKQFPEQKTLTKEDYVIICGDFGGVWEEGNRSDAYWLKWLDTKPFTTLFVDGNHENHDLLDAMPVEQWKGGKVHFVRNSVIHLMRGQMFTIDGLKFFTMGGAASHDKQFRIEGKGWWPREIPSEKELDKASINLKRAGFQVDYIITHTPPLDILHRFYPPEDDFAFVNFLEWVREQTIYRRWYFGHIHLDRIIDPQHVAIYHKIVPVDFLIKEMT